MMRGREVHAARLVDHRRLQQLGKFDQKLDAVQRARCTIRHDHRPFGADEQARGLAHRVLLALRRRCRHIAGHPRRRAMDRLLLQAGVKREKHRLLRRRHRDLVGAHEGFGEMRQRHRVVVPLGEVAHQRADVLR